MPLSRITSLCLTTFAFAANIVGQTITIYVTGGSSSGGSSATAVPMVVPKSEEAARQVGAANLVFWAVEHGDVTEVTKQVKNNPTDVIATDDKGRTALHVAALRPYGQEIARVLMANGADVNSKDYDGLTPLHEAAIQGGQELATVLIANGADVNAKDKKGRTPLHIASAPKGDVDTRDLIEVLLANHADINAEDADGLTPLYDAVASGDEFIVELLLNAHADVKDPLGRSPLSAALLREPGLHGIAQLLVRDGADVNVKFNHTTLLHELASTCRWVTLKFLLDDAYDFKPNFRIKADDGSTLLHAAARAGCDAYTARVLLTNGADVNARDAEGKTPLHAAAQSPSDSPEVARWLLGDLSANERLSVVGVVEWATRADVNARDKNGCTPLHIAAENGHSKLVTLLIAHHANTTAQCSGGLTPLQLAESHGCVDIVPMLSGGTTPPKR